MTELPIVVGTGWPKAGGAVGNGAAAGRGSLATSCSQHGHKLIKKKVRIQGAWCRLRMELHAHKGFRAMSNAFVGAIVSVGEPWFPALRQCVNVHGEPVIL